jgi:hypothetical protein
MDLELHRVAQAAKGVMVELLDPATFDDTEQLLLARTLTGVRLNPTKLRHFGGPHCGGLHKAIFVRIESSSVTVELTQPPATRRARNATSGGALAGGTGRDNRGRGLPSGT